MDYPKTPRQAEFVALADSLIFSLLTTQGSASPVCSMAPPL